MSFMVMCSEMPALVDQEDDVMVVCLQAPGRDFCTTY